MRSTIVLLRHTAFNRSCHVINTHTTVISRAALTFIIINTIQLAEHSQSCNKIVTKRLRKQAYLPLTVYVELSYLLHFINARTEYKCARCDIKNEAIAISYEYVQA